MVFTLELQTKSDLLERTQTPMLPTRVSSVSPLRSLHRALMAQAATPQLSLLQRSVELLCASLQHQGLQAIALLKGKGCSSRLSMQVKWP